ncbi:NupC/NupG family nucleoside CNT transporter [Desulfovibrio psychrotolerans]|uniref:Nucleoside:proton symporter n=1 Tax=Desulfovibrio psychrotolerans TaxID=415242 RepID=A0A7J0BUS4_9BACT|nr:nucleoside transporter C-terminal domain-containing protein [Desulfovibrio psychrotolerans]GFM36764.1 nucleoside:proton symporter [Desulfovibrio psychrotolerans]
MIQSLAGVIGFTVLAWAISEDRRKVEPRVIVAGLLLQFAAALLLLKVPVFQSMLMGLNGLVDALQQATMAGTSFIFGYLGGGALPYDETVPGGSWILAFQALPLILVVSALSALLFYWRIIPLVVRGFSLVLQRTMDVGGALGLGVAANVFVGMVEAPIIIAPYVRRMTRSELFTLMTSGMATLSGTVLVLYASILNGVLPGAIGHILTASIISAPAAILVSRLMVPEREGRTAGDADPMSDAVSSMDAITKGTAEGVKLLINVVAMLLVLVALVALGNQLLEFLPHVGGKPVTLERLLGFVMWPVVWLMGIPAAEAAQAAQLMGTKTILNEFIAYLQLAALPPDALSPRSVTIMTYAMCGFANLGSLGILIGGLAALTPERKDEVVSLGMKSIVAGTLATCMTGAVVGLLY